MKNFYIQVPVHNCVFSTQIKTEVDSIFEWVEKIMHWFLAGFYIIGVILIIDFILLSPIFLVRLPESIVSFIELPISTAYSVFYYVQENRGFALFPLMFFLILGMLFHLRGKDENSYLSIPLEYSCEKNGGQWKGVCPSCHTEQLYIWPEQNKWSCKECNIERSFAPPP